MMPIPMPYQNNSPITCPRPFSGFRPSENPCFFQPLRMSPVQGKISYTQPGAQIPIQFPHDTFQQNAAISSILPSVPPLDLPPLIKPPSQKQDFEEGRLQENFKKPADSPSKARKNSVEPKNKIYPQDSNPNLFYHQQHRKSCNNIDSSNSNSELGEGDKDYSDKIESKKPLTQSPNSPLKRSPQADNIVCKRLVSGLAYESRNVYKSIVRHIYASIKSDRDHLITILKKAGFSQEEIETCFIEISKYRSDSRPKDIERNSQVRIESMLKTKSIFSFVLKETLEGMIQKWEEGKFGQLSKANSEIYLKACKKFLQEVNELLSSKNASI